MFFLIFFGLLVSHDNLLLKDELHPIVNSAKEASLYSKQTDWPKVNRRFNEILGDAAGTEELKLALTYLLNSLGDKHGTFRSAKNPSRIIAHFTGHAQLKNRDTRPFDPEFLKNVINDRDAAFSFTEVSKGIGLLKVVGIGPGDIQKQAAGIRSGINRLHKSGVRKWILDLRFNGGGNMNPMISGLAPLIGNGEIGGSVDAADADFTNLKISDEQYYYNGSRVIGLDSEVGNLISNKVAVLLSRYTTSSGEIVAASMKGRPNTYFIGERSSGYTTGNGWQDIGNDLLMCISNSVIVDRNNQRYLKGIGVDCEIPFKVDFGEKRDPQLEKAVGWLESE